MRPLCFVTGVVQYRAKSVEMMRLCEVLLATIVEHVHGARAMQGVKQLEADESSPTAQPPSLRTVGAQGKRCLARAVIVCKASTNALCASISSLNHPASPFIACPPPPPIVRFRWAKC